MTRKECYAILDLAEGSDLAAVKRAYRKLAFSLHPDLNPGIPDAAKRFQRLNEAYVLLSQGGPAAKAAKAAREAKETGSEASSKAREDARKAYDRARTGQSAGKQPGADENNGKNTGKRKEDVLNDILNDPFARRVFEDIYSHIRYESQTRSTSGQARKPAPSPPRPRAPQKPVRKNAPAADTATKDGVMGRLKGWLRKQIDEVQVLHLPGESLVPGARVRLQIQHGITGETQTVELTLPPEFAPGKAMRLKGMGRRVGGWRGDLYVRIEPA